MKITCGCFVYNEQKYLKYAIGSIKDWVDKIIVIDGSPSGPSTDATPDILADFQKEFGDRMIRESGIYPNKEVQQNQYIKHVDRNTDWLFIIPGDEVYKQKDLDVIKGMMRKAPRNCLAIHYRHVHFWVDFRHYITGGVWDKYLYRINRWIPGCHYRKHNGLSSPNGRFMESPSLNIENRIAYHYGHAKGARSEYDKMLYYGLRGDFPNIRGRQAAESHAKAFVNNWKRMSDKGIKKFNGEHPPIIAADIANGVISATIEE